MKNHFLFSLFLIGFLFGFLLMILGCGISETKERSKRLEKVGSSDAIGSYLLTIEEAGNIYPLVEQSPTVQLNSCSQLSETISNKGIPVEAFANETMRHNDLSPGRQFSVRSDEMMLQNAAFCMPNYIVLYGGIENIVTPQELATATCHEMAHAARNHIPKELEFRQNYLMNYYKEKTSFIKNYISCEEEKCQYTHDDGAAQRLRESFAPFKNSYVTFMKRNESEADYVGMQICARAGMTPNVFAESLGALLETISLKSKESIQSNYPQILEMKELESGKTYHDLPKILLMAVIDQLIVFQEATTHPENTERIEQVNRLSSLAQDADRLTTYETFLSEMN